MKNSKLLHIIPIALVCVLAVGIGLAFNRTAEARDLPESVSSRSSWHADEEIQSSEDKFSWPSKVHIIPISKKNMSFDQGDIHELYYYFATRSQIGDLPFHYIVMSSGQGYQGHKLGDEALISMESVTDTVFIGYLYEGSEVDLGIRAIPTLKEILIDVINYYAIDPTKVSVKTLKYKIGEKGRVEDLSVENSSKAIKAKFSSVISSLSDEYTPKKITFGAELVGDPVIPAEDLEPTTTAEITITIKNTGSANLYASPGNAISLVRNDPFDERSLFYLRSSWDTPSQVILLDEGERLAVNEEKDVTFEVYVPLYPPRRTEKFVLMGPSGKPIKGTEFKIVLNIKEIDETIIEVLSTPVGFLNVRKTAGLGEVVTKVSPGERFIVKDSQTGYYQIEANGKVGWVVNTYVRVVQ